MKTTFLQLLKQVRRRFRPLRNAEDIASIYHEEEASNILQTKTKREDVIRAYLAMLGRPPENEAAIASHLSSAQTIHDLIMNFAHSDEFTQIINSDIKATHNPLYHFNASINVQDIIKSHINPDRKPLAEHYVNFLGMATPTKVMSPLANMGGLLENIPIPMNYHAGMSEWAAALRAVDLARDKFVMIELGCGWGCWMNNTGVAAKNRGLSIQLIGVEGDEKHLEFASETLKINHISTSEYTLRRGIAGVGSGYALFPSRQHADRWGAEPVFDVSESESIEAVATGQFDRLPIIPLPEVISDYSKVDLVHIDIQGGEADLVEKSISLLSEKVSYLVIGTHSRSIEGQLFDTLVNAGWLLEVERPAILHITEGKPIVRIDGIQGWVNPKFHRP